jgi:hypothetical protein
MSADCRHREAEPFCWQASRLQIIVWDSKHLPLASLDSGRITSNTEVGDIAH